MKTAAFFDLDRTLISGASVFPFAAEAWRQGLVSGREMAGWAFDALAFKLLGDTGDRSDEARTQMLGKVAGVAVERMEGVAQAVLPRLVDRVRPESRRLVEMHRDADRDTWIVSASPQGIVERLANALGMTGGIGTRGKVVDGHYTDEIEGPFVYGDGKAVAVRAISETHGYDLTRSYAYSDSVSDLPLLEVVGHPVAVNPDSELAQAAHDRGWPIVIFARRTKRAIAWTAGTTASAGLAAGTYLLGRRHGRTATLAKLASKRWSLPFAGGDS